MPATPAKVQRMWEPVLLVYEANTGKSLSKEWLALSALQAERDEAMTLLREVVARNVNSDLERRCAAFLQRLGGTEP